MTNKQRKKPAQKKSSGLAANNSATCTQTKERFVVGFKKGTNCLTDYNLKYEYRSC